MKFFGPYSRCWSRNLDAGPPDHETNATILLERIITYLLTVSKLQCKQEIIYYFLWKTTK
jgi:hypothetical protein